MTPTIICHMMSSLDGHSLTDGWNLPSAGDIYEEAAAKFEAGAWVCGRVTMQEISHGEDFPQRAPTGEVRRAHYFAKRDASQYAVSIDPKGRVTWKSDTALKSHIVEVLAESVSDDYLKHLKSVGVSYIFAGKNEVDLTVAIDILSDELGIRKFIVEGGAHVSGAFVEAGLVDEVSVIIQPLIDGRGKHPASFEFSGPDSQPAHLTLKSVEQLREGAVWLRYDVGRE